MTLKRKYANRSDWRRVTQRHYSQAFIEDRAFTGYIALLKINQVREPLSVYVGDQRICIADNGYQWLQQFPIGRSHAVTTMFDANGQIVQWYIDICQGIGVDERNVPWFEDLFLDITVLPTGKVIVKDADELEEALIKGEISSPTYDHVWQEANRLVAAIHRGEFDLIRLAEIHRDMLLTNK